jgi:hypothetical protein
MIGRKGSSLALVERREDMVVVVMLNLPSDAPPGLVDNVRACVENAVDSLPTPSTTPGKRKSAPPKKPPAGT